MPIVKAERLSRPDHPVVGPILGKIGEKLRELRHFTWPVIGFPRFVMGILPLLHAPAPGCNAIQNWASRPLAAIIRPNNEILPRTHTALHIASARDWETRFSLVAYADLGDCGPARTTVAYTWKAGGTSPLPSLYLSVQ
jgi:hypothetical protein